MNKIIFIALLFILIPLSENFAQVKKHIAFWTFDDGTAKDVSGNGYHGQIVNNPVAVAGVSGLAFKFKGTGYYIVDRKPDSKNQIPEIGDHILLPKIDLSKYDFFIISLWVKEQIYSWRHGGPYIWFGHHNYGWLGVFNHIRYEVAEDTVLNIHFSLNSKNFANAIWTRFDYSFRDRWVHYEMKYDHGILYAYIDGKLIGKSNTDILKNFNNASLGRHWWYYDGEERTASRFTGLIDEVEIYTYVNQPEDIVITGNNALCSGDSSVLCAPEGYDNYKWSSGETSRCITVKNPGSYFVEIIIEGKTYKSKDFQVSLLSNDLSFSSNGDYSFEKPLPYNQYFEKIYIKNNSNKKVTLDNLNFSRQIEFSIPQSQFPINFEPNQEKEVIISFRSASLGFFSDTLFGIGFCKPLLVKAQTEFPDINHLSPCNSNILLRYSEDNITVEGPNPNPGGNKALLTVRITQDPELQSELPSARVFDIYGNLQSVNSRLINRILPSEISETQYEFDFKDLAAGIYLIKINSKGYSKTLKYILLK